MNFVWISVWWWWWWWGCLENLYMLQILWIFLPFSYLTDTHTHTPTRLALKFFFRLENHHECVCLLILLLCEKKKYFQHTHTQERILGIEILFFSRFYSSLFIFFIIIIIIINIFFSFFSRCVMQITHMKINMQTHTHTIIDANTFGLTINVHIQVLHIFFINQSINQIDWCKKKILST